MRLNAARLDFLGITDHNDDVEEPYSWWLSQKVADCFQLENFVAFYAYERSLGYPNGHRNIFFTRRGIRILPILAWGEGEGWEGSERLFWYLRRNDGTSIPPHDGHGKWNRLAGQRPGGRAPGRDLPGDEGHL